MNEDKSRATLRIAKIPRFNTLVFKQSPGGRFFISAQDSIVIDIPGLMFIIKFLVVNNLLNIKALEGVINECREILGE